MAEWQVANQVEYSSASDENIDSFVQKYIAEINRLYELLGRLRRLDGSAVELTDTVAYQLRADYVTQKLLLRNASNEGWIELGSLNEHFGFTPAYLGAIANNGGVPSIEFGLIASRPTTEGNGAVFISTDETGGYRYYRFSTTTNTWALFDAAITKDASGNIVGSITGNAASATHAETADSADEAAHATTAATANYAATAGEAETATKAIRLATPVKINGVTFTGEQSINIGVAGNDAEAISGYQSLLWRTAENEREISNITLALEDAQIYPDYNNLLSVNFVDDAAKLDLSAVVVNASSAGSNTLDVDSLANVRKGATYTISDGTLQEQVIVADLAKNGSSYRVVLAAVLVNTYTNGSTKLYRTTATIGTGAATGASTNAVIPWYPSVEWQGVNALATLTATYETTQDTSTNFTMSGGVAFTTDGYVTLN